MMFMSMTLCASSATTSQVRGVASRLLLLRARSISRSSSSSSSRSMISGAGGARKSKKGQRQCRQSTSSSTSNSAKQGASRGQHNSGEEGGFVAWYSSMLDTHPILTKGLSSGLIAGGGDFLCQTCIETSTAFRGTRDTSSGSSISSTYDLMRTLRFTILGTFVVAPFVHVWYASLNKFVPGNGLMAVSKRVALDQFVFSPSFLPVWLTCLWTMEGERDTAVISNRIFESMPSVMMVNWGLWIPAQVINFRFVPVKFQVLYSNVIALLFNAYLSYSQTTRDLQTSTATFLFEDTT